MAARGLVTPLRSLAVLVVLACAWTACRPAWAQADDVFAARGVPVDATDATAAAARVKAIAEGQRRGLRIVFERLAG